MKRDFSSMYDGLTAEERFQLVVEAFAREDERETERLTNTCPRIAYEMNDLAFVERLRASQLISSYVGAELIEVLAMLRTIEACRRAVDTYQEVLYSSLEWATDEAALSYHQGWKAGCDHAWQAADKHGPFPWNDKASLNERAKEMAKRVRAENRSEAGDDSPQDTLGEASEALSVRVWTIWEAFSRFCRGQTGLEPEAVLRACFPPALGVPEELENAVGSVQVDAALLEEHEATLARIWGELVGSSN